MLGLAMVSKVRAQNGEGGVQTFFNSRMPFGTVQVNATAQIQPAEDLTLWLSIAPFSGVLAVNFTLNVYGFQNGTIPELIGNITENLQGGNLTLYSSRALTLPIHVPDDVWGVTFGNIALTYSIYGGESPNVIPDTTGFYMTDVVNTFLEGLQSQLDSLNETYCNLTNTYSKLNQTFVQLQHNYTMLDQNYTILQQNYTTLQANLGQLDNTREVAIILAITTVFFVATTVFMIARRPRESW
jgi:hypothetical protein